LLQLGQQPLPRVVERFKANVTRQLHAAGVVSGQVWDCGFHDLPCAPMRVCVVPHNTLWPIPYMPGWSTMRVTTLIGMLPGLTVTPACHWR